MKSQKLTAVAGDGWQSVDAPVQADLTIYFGARETLQDGRLFDELRDYCPKATIIGCSTGGQILDDDVTDDVATAVAMEFDSTQIRLAVQRIADGSQSRACGAGIGRDLMAPDLAGVFVLSDGLGVNGSELTAGIVAEVCSDISVSGGLAGDGSAFQQTLVGANAVPETNMIAAVGFYGSHLRLRTGSGGGWDEFGPRRKITRSEGNVLHELDGQPALDLYMRYLGEEAEGLPGTALLFPLKVSHPDRPEHDIMRTILSVDRESKVMTFAGDVPQGWSVQLMRGRFDQLAAGSAEAARQAQASPENDGSVALLVSCIGRRLLMGQLVSDEIDAAVAELGRHTTALGFYSYGEIAPHPVSHVPELHNQTMTITTIGEAA